MAGRKEYEMLFQLNAQLGGSYSKTFKAAQQEIVSMQKEIQALSKTQADISAFQKQQAAVEATRKRLEMLRQQYDNIQREMEETGNESADMKNKLLAKQIQIDKTSASLEKQTAKLNELSGALEEAGVNTDDLSHSSEQLAGKIDTLKKKQGEAADKAMTFGDKAGQAFNQVHEAIVAAGIAVALKEIYEYFASCAQASMDFESAITGVAKTTDLTDEELAAMSDSIKALSTEIPATTEEIAAVTEAAGQLGIQKDALLDFTEIMTMLGTATNMTADEAATSLARFANITGMATDNYGRLGSVIVDLGNNFATTESEIVAMGTRLASAGKLAGLTEPEIMALAAAMSSVGIEAEAGGTAMTQTLNAIEKAVAKGGDDLAEFARIAGMSSEEFSSAWKNDAMSALTSFIGGLGKLDEQGESTVLVLEDLGLTGIRQSNMLKALGLAADQMTGAMNTANTAWQQALRHRAEPVDHDAERLQQPQGSHRRRLYSRAQRGLRRRHEGPQQHYGVHSEEPGIGQCHHRLCRRDRRGRRRAGCLCGRCKDSRSRQCHPHSGDPRRQCHHGRYRCRGRNHGGHRCSGHRCGE